MTPGRGGDLFAWLLRRVLGTVLVLLGASGILFAVVRASPGDAGDSAALLSPSAVAPSPSDSRRGFDADSAWHSQYLAWLSGAVRGDFGTSAALRRGHPVGALLWPAAGRSLSLGAASLLISSAVAVSLAWLRRARPESRCLAVSDTVLVLSSAVPVFLLGYVVVVGGNALMAWGAREGLWGLPAWFPLPSRDDWVPWALAVAALALGDGLLLDLYQRFRAELDHASTGEYLVGARALGLPVSLLVARAFAPGAFSHLCHRLSFLLGSLVVIESALGWPGMGYLAWRAAAERDTPVLLGIAFVLALVARLGTLLADGLIYVADPRSRCR